MPEPIILSDIVTVAISAYWSVNGKISMMENTHVMTTIYMRTLLRLYDWPTGIFVRIS